MTDIQRGMRAVDRASDAFWAVIAAEYPEIRTGDFGPEESMAWEAACDRAVKTWLRNNAPPTYEQRCAAATEDQGLTPFDDADGWEVEQTGGFCMVAYRYMPDGSVWSVTMDGDPYYGQEPYMCIHAVQDWDGSEEGLYETRFLPLEDALKVGK